MITELIGLLLAGLLGLFAYWLGERKGRTKRDWEAPTPKIPSDQVEVIDDERQTPKPDPVPADVLPTDDPDNVDKLNEWGDDLLDSGRD